MNGQGNVRFGELFADTISVHGVTWAAEYYHQHGMPDWELAFWLKNIAGESLDAVVWESGYDD